MALVVFLRGVNVGGHRTFRPSVLARQLRAFDVVNVGAAGTFVVRKPGTRAKFRAALARRLPFAAGVVLCEGRELLRLASAQPFGRRPAPKDVTRFVSVRLARGRGPTLARIKPRTLPPGGRWLVRVVGARGRFVLGEYRRDMKTIGCLGRLDQLCGGPVTTRNWNTILAVARVLEA